MKHISRRFSRLKGQPISSRLSCLGLLFGLGIVVASFGCRRAVSPEATYARIREEARRGQLDIALHDLDAAIAKYQSRNPEWGWRFRVQKAHILVVRGAFDEALQLLNESPPPSLDHSDAAVRRKMVQGIAHDYLQKYPEGERDLTEAFELATAYHPELLGEVLQARGNLEISKKNYPAAAADFEQALQLDRKQNLVYQEATVLGSLGYLAVWQEHYDEAIEWFKTALQKSRDLGSESTTAKTLGNIGWNYWVIGDLENAEEMLKDAEKASVEAGLPGDQVKWLNDLSSVYLQKHRYDLARPRSEEALQLARKVGDNRDITGCLNSAADIALAMGRLEESEKFNQEALGRESAGLDRDQFNIAASTIIAGRIAASKKQYGEAEKAFQKIIDDPGSGTPLRWEAQAGIAEVSAAQGKASLAERQFLGSIGTITNAWNGLKEEEFRLSFLSSAIRFYDAYVNFLIDQKRPLDALRIADLSRAQTLERGLASSENGAPNGAATHRSKDRPLQSPRQQRGDGQAATHRSSRQDRDANSAKDRPPQQQQIGAATHRSKDRPLQQRIGDGQATDGQAKDGPVTNVKAQGQVQAAAFGPQETARRLNATLLFYWLGEASSHLWVITPGRVSLLPLPGRAEIDSTVKSYLKIFTDPRDPLEAGNADGKKLYETLIAPVEGLIPKDSRVIILPDSELNTLNFETLIVPGDEPGSGDSGGQARVKGEKQIPHPATIPRGGAGIRDDRVGGSPHPATIPHGGGGIPFGFAQGKRDDKPGGCALNAGCQQSCALEAGCQQSRKPHYWVEDVTVLIGNSLALLAKISAAAPPKNPSLFLMGDALQASPDFPALPQAGKEVGLVEKYFAPDKRKILTGAQATASAYLSDHPEKYSYLHFSAHGTASSKRPLESAVILSPEGDSYKLYARDIVQHPLTAYLVTISACNGAGMRTYAGEGLVGLAWAFLRAGAHNVIGGLWEVSNASTPQLMDELYKGLGEGKDPATALRNAKLSLVHSTGNYRRPYYWGPFQLYAGS